MEFISVDYTNYYDSIATIFNKLDVERKIQKCRQILLKPNLVTAREYPATTNPECCEAIIQHLRKISEVRIIISEGSGNPDFTTGETSDRLGYRALAKKYNVKLLDLNNEPSIKLKNPDCVKYKEIYLPEIVFDSFLISIPVLKTHAFSTISGTIKNMMGLLPPKHYFGVYGVWRKAQFHKDIHQSITDLNTYRTADLTILDAAVGMENHHLRGKPLIHRKTR